MRASHRLRLALNLVNGSTLSGLAVARLGRARLCASGEGGLLTAVGYVLPVPSAPAFTLGNVIITRRPWIDPESDLFRHEARHATQYACCGGLLMLPCYFAGAGVSWLLSGDVGAWNPFERLAGLADGGYRDHPLLASPEFRRLSVRRLLPTGTSARSRGASGTPCARGRTAPPS